MAHIRCIVGKLRRKKEAYVQLEVAPVLTWQDPIGCQLEYNAATRLEIVPATAPPSKITHKNTHTYRSTPATGGESPLSWYVEISSVKIKLQLFPINEQTCLGLEKDGYNPYLELTLSARKRISSVVRHLNTKWGSSSVAIGQLVLFPYNTKLEQVTSCKRWTLNDSAITAWEVYVDVGSPSIFRLRYGWCSDLQHCMFDIPPKSSLLETRTDSEGVEIPSHQEEKLEESCETNKNQINVNEALHSDVNEQKTLDVPTGFVDNESTDVVRVHSSVLWDDNLTNLSIGGLLSEISMQGKINTSDPNSVNKSSMQPIGLISDISIGDLFSEASLMGKMGNPCMKLENESSLQPFFLASSDISIGGLLSEASLFSNKNKLDTQTMEAGHAQFQSPWNDSFTTLSIGGLLSEASLQDKAGGNPELKESKSSLQPNTPIPGSSDSLISAQLNAPLQIPKLSCDEPNLSILDAEETCHAFPVRKPQTDREATTSNERVSSGECSKGTSSKQFQFRMFDKMNNETGCPKDSSCRELKTSPLPHSLGALNEDSSRWPVRHQSGMYSHYQLHVEPKVLL
ncbi:hypothetical protein DH2020_047842 [Rehmannia glutinosa]|uniref:Uncharacterized protein n=1 Tax=Rehmannia glutinosa TaxID=99300 RepID=A0ABR0U8D4_REHGL